MRFERTRRHRSSGGNNTAANAQKAVKFAECMRSNGVSEFPDPGASGKFTIDAVANGSSLDPSTPAFKQAISACKDLEPAGFMGSKRSPQQQQAALKFAQCIRENGVKDFPDPIPMVGPSSTRIESHPPQRRRWDEHSQRRDAEVPRCAQPQRGSRGEAEDVGAGRSGRPGCRDRHRRRGRHVRREATGPGRTAGAGWTPRRWRSRTLSAMVSQAGILTYRARSDGSPYSVINQARGTYTKLPAVGQVISQGQVLYRVNDSPVVLLYGSTPAYRTLSAGASGPDVAELNADLVALGYATSAQLIPSPPSSGRPPPRPCRSSRPPWG